MGYGVRRISAAGNYVEVHAAGKVHLIREPPSTKSAGIANQLREIS